jgi:hypothetical protein
MNSRTVDLYDLAQDGNVGHELGVPLDRGVCDLECFVEGPERDPDALLNEVLGENRIAGQDCEE